MNAADLLAELLGKGPYETPEPAQRLLRVTGKDAAEFLHRLCTQDVLGLREGELAPGAFLDAKGKLLATCRIGRLGDGYWLETTQEQEQPLARLLEKYHFTEKLTIEPSAMRGRGERATLARAGDARRAIETAADGLRVTFERRGVRFERTYANADAPPIPGDPRMANDGRGECIRMLAGLVRVGVETEPTTLALEADLDDHISTTKGCYTGQEIVARINTYGHTNRKLCLLLLAPGAPIAAPLPLHELEDKLAVGRVMHAITIPDRTERLGVGYLPRDFQAIGTKLALADGSAVEVIGYEPLPPLPA